jgi:shikimate dehydrogenase
VSLHRDRYAVAGNPVAHSRSPAIHAAFAEQTGQAVVYERLLCPMDGFEATVRAFEAAGGRGCNVTVPFKLQTPAMAAQVSARAALAGAANLLRFDSGGWFADNTDGVGLVRDIETGAGRALAGCRVLLVGAGGAGAGVLGPLLAARPAEVVVVNRSVDKALALAERHAAVARAHGAGLRGGGLDAPGRDFDVVINASASSLQGAPSPVGRAVFAPGALAVDLMYGPAARPWPGRKPPAPTRGTAWACWWNRRPKPSSSGAA